MPLDDIIIMINAMDLFRCDLVNVSACAVFTESPTEYTHAHQLQRQASAAVHRQFQCRCGE